MSAGRTPEGAGCIAWWGFSPARDLLSAGPARPTGDLNLLLVGSADPRHVLKTVTALQERDNLHVWVLENSMEVVARQMLLLWLALTPQEDMGLNEKTEVFLEVFGNSKIRSQTAETLKRVSAQLSLSVTNTMETPTHPCLDTSQLKYRERDELVRIFKLWSEATSSSSSSSPRAVTWDSRVRQHLGTRYDSRRGSFDWDLSMKLHQKGCGLIDGRQYARWREGGVAFEMRDDAYKMANPTLMSSRVFNQKGGKVAVRGYWGDIVSSPYLSFGVETEDQDLLRTQNGKHVKTAQDVSIANVQALFRSLSGKRGLCASPETETETEMETGEVRRRPAGVNGLVRLRGVSVTFLSLDALIKMPERQKFHHLFNSIYFSASAVHRLGPSLRQLAAAEAVLTVELAKNVLDLSRDQEVAFAAKARDAAAQAGFEPWPGATGEEAQAVFTLRKEQS